MFKTTDAARLPQSPCMHTRKEAPIQQTWVEHQSKAIKIIPSLSKYKGKETSLNSLLWTCKNFDLLVFTKSFIVVVDHQKLLKGEGQS